MIVDPSPPCPNQRKRRDEPGSLESSTYERTNDRERRLQVTERGLCAKSGRPDLAPISGSPLQAESHLEGLIGGDVTRRRERNGEVGRCADDPLGSRWRGPKQRSRHERDGSEQARHRGSKTSVFHIRSMTRRSRSIHPSLLPSRGRLRSAGIHSLLRAAVEPLLGQGTPQPKVPTVGWRSRPFCRSRRTDRAGKQGLMLHSVLACPVHGRRKEERRLFRFPRHSIAFWVVVLASTPACNVVLGNEDGVLDDDGTTHELDIDAGARTPDSGISMEPDTSVEDPTADADGATRDGGVTADVSTKDAATRDRFVTPARRFVPRVRRRRKCRRAARADAAFNRANEPARQAAAGGA